METKVLYCGCTSADHIPVKCGGNKVKQYADQRVFPTQGAEFQDKTYGKGNRVHNVTRNGVRCTICGRTK